jgi:Flp pilus assembly protein TadG
MNARRAHLTTSNAASGQAIVEFALSSLFFLATILAICEGGRLLFSYGMLTYAVQEGGRAAALPAPATNTTTDICNAIAAKTTLISIACTSTLVQNAAGVTKTFADRTTGDRVTVTGTYTFAPVVTSLFNDPTEIEMTYSAVFTVE